MTKILKHCNHQSVGVIIKKNERMLLIDRKKFPCYWASVAGHIEDNELPNVAAKREVKEEVGLRIRGLVPLLTHKRFNNPCRRGGSFHYWWVYLADCSGKIRIKKDEVKRYGWFTKEEIREMIAKKKIEPVWVRIFQKTKALK